jgi:SulP family sulfate permease
MFGFVNGLAIIIFMSQLEQFKTCKWRVFGYQVVPMFIMLGLVALTIAMCSLSS